MKTLKKNHTKPLCDSALGTGFLHVSKPPTINTKMNWTSSKVTTLGLQNDTAEKVKT